MAERRTKPPAKVAVYVRSDEEVYAMGRTALRHAMKRTGASVRAAARWMRTTPSVVQRGLAGKRPVNPLIVLRSRRLSKHFLGCLVLLNGRRA